MTTILPFIHYERADLPVVAMRGKVLIEDVTVAYPGEAGGPALVKRYTLWPTEGEGTMIQFDTGWQPSEEGGSQEGLTVEQEGDMWEVASYTSSRDCDGPLERCQTWTSPGGTDPNAPAWYPDRSPWDKAGGHQRDHYAEAAGY